MKRSKVGSKSSAFERKRSPVRKMLSSRKSTMHSSPPRSHSSHSNMQRSLSSLKRGTPSGAKHLRSPRDESPSPSARHGRNQTRDSSAHRRHLSHKKSYELVKRSPDLPLGRGLSGKEMPVRSFTPPQSSQYPSTRRRNSDQDFDCPPKKKLNRYPPDHSTHIPASKPVPQRSESSHRSDLSGHQGRKHAGARDSSLTRSNRPSSSHFHSQGNGQDGYLRNPFEKLKRPEPPRMYMDEKPRGLTLDQRFGPESNHDMEPRIHYSRSDLENITVDIRPAARESSPTIRRIINPDDIRLVRRPNEGKKPIFDRQEIKQAPRDMREDARYEHVNILSSVTASTANYELTRKELKNYEITRHKFDSYRGPSSSNEMRTLNDRWQKLDNKKDERMAQSYMGKLRCPDSFSDDDRPSIPQPYDRDYRNNKYSQDREPPYHRSDYPDNNRSLSSNSADLRHNLSVRRKIDVPDSHDRMLNRRDDEAPSHWHSIPKGMPSSPDKMRGKRSISRGSRAISPQWDYESQRNRGSPRGEKLLSYAQRSDSFKYQSWSEKQDVPPSRSPSYFEHMDSYPSEAGNFRSPGRASGKPSEAGNFRSPGRASGKNFRSRPFRGRRAGMRGRGVFRGGSGYRGYNSRGNNVEGKKYSGMYATKDGSGMDWKD